MQPFFRRKAERVLKQIKRCAMHERLLYTRHAKCEMELEELGEIMEEKVFEAVLHGKIIEDYPEDVPYPSCLVHG
jgi:hypothetical protein